MSASGSNGRKFPCWIDAFLDFTEGLPTPRLFRKWAAISAVGGALERKVWTRSMRRPLYPNTFVLLVAPPGIGKTVALVETYELLLKLPEHHISPTSMTKAALIDALAEAKRSIVRPADNPPVFSFHSLYVTAPEFGVLVPAYDTEFMNNLTDLYDNRTMYEERIRSRPEPLRIENPQLNMIGGTTPQFLSQMLPDVAWGQGLMSRMILVYSGENFPRALELLHQGHGKYGFTVEQEFDLIEDLKKIGTLFGQMRWEKAAGEAMENWHMSGGGNPPSHSRLEHYNTRRTAHLLKLAMISSCARRSDYVIGLEDFQRALGWMSEAEEFMPDIFKAMVGGGDSNIAEDAWHYAWQLWASRKTLVTESMLTTFIMTKAPAHSVAKIIEVMVKAGKMKEVGYDPQGRKIYQPIPKVGLGDAHLPPG